MDNNLQRLQKLIANRGYCSRRKAEELIIAKRVKVNDEIIDQLGVKFPNDVIIKIDDQEIQSTPKKIYLLFYKPLNCLTTTTDPLKRKTVLDYLKHFDERIYPIGRLDYKTSGLLLLTNDGEFANIIMHPKHQINKKYDLTAKGQINKSKIEQLLQGVIIDNDFLAKANEIEIKNIDAINKTYNLIITINDGHNQQIRKMIKAISGHVLTLERIAIDFLILKPLKMGEYRHLTNSEVKKFFNYENSP